MKLSAKSDYAARAVMGLARHYQSGASMRVEDLAAEQGIPSNYLVQILLGFKSREIVRSVRGKEGGGTKVGAPLRGNHAGGCDSLRGRAGV